MKKMYPSNLHRFVEFSAFIVLIISFFIAVYGMNTLPDNIAIHFDIHGNPDGYGSPKTLILTSILMCIPMGIMSICAHFVDVECMNLTFKLSKINKAEVRKSVQLMMYLLELEFSVFGLFITLKSYNQSGSGIFSAVFVLIVIMTATIVWGMKDSKRKNGM